MGIGDFSLSLPEVDESGNNPLENAKIKALAYYQALHEQTDFDYPLFSCDSGLYIDGLIEKEQPGVHVKRVDSKNLTAEEMIAYYSSLAGRLGGKATARYKNAICLVLSAMKYMNIWAIILRVPNSCFKGHNQLHIVNRRYPFDLRLILWPLSFPF